MIDICQSLTFSFNNKLLLWLCLFEIDLRSYWILPYVLEQGHQNLRLEKADSDISLYLAFRLGLTMFLCLQL